MKPKPLAGGNNRLEEVADEDDDQMEREDCSECGWVLVMEEELESGVCNGCSYGAGDAEDEEAEEDEDEQCA